MKATYFVIDRSKWHRGTAAGSRLLRLDNGKMCCLGFYALACGLTPEAIQDECLYRQLSIEAQAELPHELLEKALHQFLVMTNDSPELSDHRREKLITDNFATIGVAVEFIGVG